ncbi:MAG TPA: MFS transporter [Gammaproteobacteria bacterium]|nr:MFS transporter [Gammaproteobacteria bacterium]
MSGSFKLRDIHPTTRRLLAARFTRSVGQGVLIVDLALYLHALGWSGAAIGATLSGAGFFAAFGSIAIGIISDRFRRKPFLLYNEALTVVCGLLLVFTLQPWVLIIAIVLGGFGRGQTGSAGPFSPAEQSWLAEAVAAERRGRIYSLNAALGFFGMALGAGLAMLPFVWRDALGEAGAYRPLFGIVVIGAVVNLWLLGGARESLRAAKKRQRRELTRRQRGSAEQKRENRMLIRLAQMNAANGLAIGLTSPLISYWFALKFGIGPEAIAPVMALAFASAAIASMMTGRLTDWLGVARSVVVTRGVGVVMLGVLPLSPFFLLAALIYLLRVASSGGSLGARWAQVVSLVSDERRGLATSANAASFQVPQAIGPAIAGTLIGAGWFAIPFYAGAFLQGVYVAAYGRVFGRWEREEAQRSVT